MTKRRYNKTLRAEQQDETRDRIVLATVALHQQLGPANTSIKAIAEKAGVQRLTVYRHFPDEASLFQACTSHYLGQHPPPSMTEWAELLDPAERSRAALLALYHYYRETADMWRVAYRDLDRVAALKAPMDQFEAYLDQVRDDLLASWDSRQKTRKSLGITLRHCLRFSTWDSLSKQGLPDKKIAKLALGWIDR